MPPGRPTLARVCFRAHPTRHVDAARRDARPVEGGAQESLGAADQRQASGLTEGSLEWHFGSIATSPAPEGSAAAPGQADGASVAEQAARAGAALAAGDLEGYRAPVLAGGRAHEDPNRRYQAQKSLLERGLAAAGQASGARCLEIYVAVAEAAIAVLEHEPRPSRSCSTTPALPCTSSGASTRHARCSWRRSDSTRASLPAAKPDGDCAIASGSAGGRPPATCTRPCRRSPAGPRRSPPRPSRPTGLTLSLCMIVRDEEEMLPRCLEAVAPAVDEIIIVDTGSRDGTSRSLVRSARE